MDAEIELTNDQFLALEPGIEKVLLTGGFTYVRGMNGTERDQWEQTVMYHKKKSPIGGYEHFRASLVVRTACNVMGERRFVDKDVERVSKIDAVHLDRMWDAGARLSGVTEQAAEEIGKNLPTGPSGDSS